MIFWKQCRRAAILTAGALVALTGLILMPVPGPGGTPVFLAGLMILSGEAAWAQRLLARFKASCAAMSPRRRRVLTYSALAFYAASGIAAWSLFAKA